jgi:transmembrane sensor
MEWPGTAIRSNTYTMTSDSRLEYLMERYFNKDCSEAERQELFRLIDGGEHNAAIKAWMDGSVSRLSEQHQLGTSASKQILEAILGEGDVPVIPITVEPQQEMAGHYQGWRAAQRWWAAAAVLLLLAGGSYWWIIRPFREPMSGQLVSGPASPRKIGPGGYKATLTLGNGAQILLDSAHDGALAQQGHVKIIKSNNRELSYLPAAGGRQTAAPEGVSDATGSPVPVYNTLSTPNGGQYQLTLPDGSQAWLNAASSIKYPTEFRGKERAVEITGEVYFEIAGNERMPFHVRADGADIHVLGTHFNVSAYPDDDFLKATLVEGRILFTQGLHQRILHPGEQAVVSRGSDQFTVKEDVDLDEAVAWKNGFFQFSRADLKTVMRAFSRWYGVRVVYEAGTFPQQFGGKIQRDLTLQDALDVLQKSQVHFKIQGNTLTVMP